MTTPAHPPAGGHHDHGPSWSSVMWSVIAGLFVLGAIIYPSIEAAIRTMQHAAGTIIAMVLLMLIPLVIYLLVSGKVSIPTGGGGHGGGH